VDSVEAGLSGTITRQRGSNEAIAVCRTADRWILKVAEAGVTVKELLSGIMAFPMFLHFNASTYNRLS
jgi:hypothetical protein